MSSPVTTFKGYAPVMSNADTWIHLAGGPGTLCGYHSAQLRAATRRDLNVNPDSTLGRGFCPTCFERGLKGGAS